MAREAIVKEEIFYESEENRNCDLIKGAVKSGVEEWQKWHNDMILNGKGLKLNSVMDKVSTKSWSAKYKNLTGGEIKIINRLSSGHDHSNKYLKMWRKIDTDICESCGVLSDGNHVILKCNKYERSRIKYQFIKKYSSVQELIKMESEINLKKLIEFIKLSDITI